MIYVYDIVLNLNENLIEFFEWEEQDNIKCIRKLPFYKINNNFMKDLINCHVSINKEFLDKLKNKALVAEDYNYEYKYLCLFTDNKIILGVLFNDEGKNKYISKLLLDEEEEILLLGNRLQETKISYEIIGNKEKTNNTLTRKEIKIKESLTKEFLHLYKFNKVDKLNYYYFEYFNEIDNDKDKVYNKLIDSLNNNFNEKHINLYKIIQLSYSHK